LVEPLIKPGFDGAGLHRVENLQPRHDFTSCEALDLELVVGDLGNALGEILRISVKRIERFRPARRQAPLDLR